MHFLLFMLILFSSHFAQICRWSGSLWGFSFLPSSAPPSPLPVFLLGLMMPHTVNALVSLCLVLFDFDFCLGHSWLTKRQMLWSYSEYICFTTSQSLLHRSIHPSICHHGPIATFQSPDRASFIGSRLSKDAQTDNQTDRLLAEATLVCLQSETGRRGSAATKTLYFNKPLNSLLAL